jgi:excisionase family DNA binding protein
MNEIVFSQISLNELETLIQRSLRKVLSEKLEQFQPEFPDRCELSEAVKITGLSKSQLYKMTHSKKIPFQKFGKKLVFNKQALLKWVEDNTVSVIPSDYSIIKSLAKSANKKKNL